MLRLTGTERGVAEVTAIAEHVASLTAASAAFQLRPDVPKDADGAPLVPLIDEHNAGDASATLVEIRAWAREALDVDRVPAIWRAFAHQPRLLDTTWRKHRLILGAGTLDEMVKGCAALAVAQFRQSDYWIAYLTRLLKKRSRVEDRALVEIAGAVMHYVSFNTIAHGMRLDAPISDMTAGDVAPGGRFERYLPGGRLPPPTSAGASSSKAGE